MTAFAAVAVSAAAKKANADLSNFFMKQSLLKTTTKNYNYDLCTPHDANLVPK